MQITEVQLERAENTKHAFDDRLKAFATITIDGCFVVHDIKVIEGRNNGLFVAMPNRKLSDNCPVCHCKNSRSANYCNQCGRKLPPSDTSDLYADVCHPINSACRRTINQAVIKEYWRVLKEDTQQSA